MPKDAPDYSNVAGAGILGTTQGFDELAVRLGSPVRFDRGGNVLFMDSFEGGVASWQKTEGATGGSVAATAEDYRTGHFSAKLVSGSGELEGSQLYRAFPYPELNKYGFESSVQLNTTVLYMIWTMALRDGENEHQFQIMYIPGEDQFVVTIPGGSSLACYEDIALAEGRGLFHNVKLVADFETLKYVRLIVNEHSVDLSEYEPYTFPNDASPHMVITFSLYGNTGDNDVVYIDDVIVTRREP